MRAVTLSLVGFLVLSSVALWAGDAPPAVDRHDPAGVARAYIAALKAADVKAAAAFMTKDPGVRALSAVMGAELNQQFEGGLFSIQGLSESALLPVGLAPDADLGAAAAGDKGAKVFELHRTVDLHPKLVLVPQPDGTWLVDVRASLAATAGKQPDAYAKLIEQMGNMPEEQADAAAGMQQMPWQCIQKMNQLAEALVAYAEEHDNRLPLAAVWQDAITPYVDGEKPFTCPDHKGEECSYSFNAALSEKPLPTDWNQRNDTVLLACTGADVPNAVFTIGDLKKLTGRHGNYNAIAHASGQGEGLPVGMSYDELLAARKSTETCAERLRALVTAAKAFAKAHDGLLPAAATWCDDLEPLIKQHQGNPFACPDSPKADCCYAINRAVAGKRLKDLVNLRKIVLFVEVGPTTRNAAVDTLDGYPGRHRAQWQPGLLWHKAMLNGTVTAVQGKEPEAAAGKG
jgi:hypothetical protein